VRWQAIIAMLIEQAGGADTVGIASCFSGALDTVRQQSSNHTGLLPLRHMKSTQASRQLSTNGRASLHADLGSIQCRLAHSNFQPIAESQLRP
jgi:hypothetical protein